MRCSLLAVVCVLLAAAGTAAADTAEAVDVVVARETRLRPAISPGVAIGALTQIANIYNTKFFDSKGALDVGKLLSTGLGFVKFLFGIFDNPNKALENYLRQQFAAVHRKLDTIANRIEDLLRQIKLEGTLAPLRTRTQEIQALSDYLHDYVAEANADRRARERQRFLTQCGLRSAGLLQAVYNSLMRSSSSINENVGEAALHYTQHHRANVAKMLLDVNRYILRGIEVEVACLRVAGNKAAADHELSVWQGRMGALSNKLFAFDRRSLSHFSRNWKAEVRRVMQANSHKANRDVANAVYQFAADKFYWRSWLVISHNRDSNKKNFNYYGTYDGGMTERHEHNGKVVLVTHRDPKSRFDVNRAARVLQDVDGLRSRAAPDFHRRLVAGMGSQSGYSLFTYLVSDLVNAEYKGDRRTAYRWMTYTIRGRTWAMRGWLFG